MVTLSRQCCGVPSSAIHYYHAVVNIVITITTIFQALSTYAHRNASNWAVEAVDFHISLNRHIEFIKKQVISKYQTYVYFWPC